MAVILKGVQSGPSQSWVSELIGRPSLESATCTRSLLMSLNFHVLRLVPSTRCIKVPLFETCLMSQGEAKGVDCAPKGDNCMRGSGMRRTPAREAAAGAYEITAVRSAFCASAKTFWPVLLTREYTRAAPNATPPAKPPRKDSRDAGSSALGTMAKGTSTICGIS